MNREKKILSVLIVILACCILYRIMNPYRQATVEHLTYSGKPNQSGQPAAGIRKIEREGRSNQTESTLGSEILVDLFVSPPFHGDKTVRNLFVMPEQETEGAFAPPVETPAPQDSNQPISGPTEEMQPEGEPLRAFGFFRQGKDKVVFLEREKDVFSVREGDLIDGKYVVESVSDDRVVLRSKETGMQTTLDIN